MTRLTSLNPDKCPALAVTMSDPAFLRPLIV